MENSVLLIILAVMGVGFLIFVIVVYSAVSRVRSSLGSFTSIFRNFKQTYNQARQDVQSELGAQMSANKLKFKKGSFGSLSVSGVVNNHNVEISFRPTGIIGNAMFPYKGVAVWQLKVRFHSQDKRQQKEQKKQLKTILTSYGGKIMVNGGWLLWMPSTKNGGTFGRTMDIVKQITSVIT